MEVQHNQIFIYQAANRCAWYGFCQFCWQNLSNKSV